MEFVVLLDFVDFHDLHEGGRLLIIITIYFSCRKDQGSIKDSGNERIWLIVCWIS